MQRDTDKAAGLRAPDVDRQMVKVYLPGVKLPDDPAVKAGGHGEPDRNLPVLSLDRRDDGAELGIRYSRALPGILALRDRCSVACRVTVQVAALDAPRAEPADRLRCLPDAGPGQVTERAGQPVHVGAGKVAYPMAAGGAVEPGEGGPVLGSGLGREPATRGDELGGGVLDADRNNPVDQLQVAPGIELPAPLTGVGGLEEVQRAVNVPAAPRPRLAPLDVVAGSPVRPLPGAVREPSPAPSAHVAMVPNRGSGCNQPPNVPRRGHQQIITLFKSIRCALYACSGHRPSGAKSLCGRAKTPQNVAKRRWSAVESSAKRTPDLGVPIGQTGPWRDAGSPAEYRHAKSREIASKRFSTVRLTPDPVAGWRFE